MAGLQWLDPRNDFLFKRILGAEENLSVLTDFINAVFEDADEPTVTDVEVLNPALGPESLGDKAAMLDIKARTADGVLIDVEIQMVNHRDMEKRTLYYWAKLFGQQLERGDDYRELHRTVTINVLDFSYIPGQVCHTTYAVREATSGHRLTDLLEIHFVELPKRQAEPPRRARLAQWLLFLTTRQEKELEVLRVADPIFKRAVETLEYLSQDPVAREAFLAREKGRQTYQADIAGSREEGREEGRQEGWQEAQKQMAAKLLAMGLSVDQVAHATGLSPAEVEALHR